MTVAQESGIMEFKSDTSLKRVGVLKQEQAVSQSCASQASAWGNEDSTANKRSLSNGKTLTPILLFYEIRTRFWDISIPMSATAALCISTKRSTETMMSQHKLINVLKHSFHVHHRFITRTPRYGKYISLAFLAR